MWGRQEDPQSTILKSEKLLGPPREAMSWELGKHIHLGLSAAEVQAGYGKLGEVTGTLEKKDFCGAWE